MNAMQPKTAGLERCFLTGNINISHAQSVKHTVSTVSDHILILFRIATFIAKAYFFFFFFPTHKFAHILPCYRSANGFFSGGKLKVLFAKADSFW